MKPSELDYSRTTKHYYDTTNGEVIAGAEEYAEYLLAHPNPEAVQDLGVLVRTGYEPAPDIDTANPAIKKWTVEQCVEYGRWLVAIVAPPADAKSERRINKEVINTAARLGVGPNAHKLRYAFGTLGKFYAQINAGDTHAIGNFREWSLDDYIAYIRSVGGDRRPTYEQLNEIGRKDPSKPKGDYIRTKFQHIGGFIKAIELAGYPAIDLWTEEDFVAWGVKFMEANDGTLPTSRMANYFSKKRKGPSGRGIIDRFGKMGRFQQLVLQKYYEQQTAKQEAEDALFARMQKDFDTERLPDELFAVPKQERGLQKQELLRRYAKYLLVCALTPQPVTKHLMEAVTASRFGDEFAQTVKSESNLSQVDIENAALALNIFDEVWPFDDYKTSLKLDKGYEAYYKKTEKVKKLLHW